MKRFKLTLFLLVLLSTVFSSFAVNIPTFESNPFGLVDPSTYDVNTNVCTTISNNFRIDTFNCLNEDIDGKNIEQEIKFTWNGDLTLDTDFIFVYEGQLKSGNIYLEQNVTKQRTIYLQQDITELINYSNVTNFNVIGNTASFNFTNVSNSSNVILEFNSYTNISNNYTFNVSKTISEESLENYTETQFTDITNQFNYLGYDLFGKGFRYYSVSNINFPAGKSYTTKWVYTPKDANKTGKFHIFGKPSSLTLNQAVSQGAYIYQDPWWNSSWNYKREITVTSDGSYTNYVFQINLTTSNFDYSKTDGTDIRILNSAEDTELDYRRYSWNSGGTSEIYIQSNLTEGSNTFYIYYNNSLASDTSNPSLTLTSSVDYDNISFTNQSFYSSAITKTASIELSNGKVAIIYAYSGNTALIRCDKDGTNCSTPYVFYGEQAESLAILDDAINENIIAITGSSSGTNLNGYYFRIPYTTNSAPAMAFNPASTNYVSGAQLNSTHLGIAYQDTADSNHLTYIVCSLTSSSCDTEVDISTAPSGYINLIKNSNSEMSLLFQRIDASPLLGIRKFDLDGSNIVSNNIETGNTNTNLKMIEGSDNKLKIIYKDVTDTNDGTFLSCELDGSSCGGEVDFNTAVEDLAISEFNQKLFITARLQSDYKTYNINFNLTGGDISSTSQISPILINGGEISQFITSDNTLFMSYVDNTNSLGQFSISQDLGISDFNITSSIASQQTQTEVTNLQLSELSYLDLSDDGTNYGKTSTGFTSSESHIFNISVVDDTTDQTLILSRTELDGAFTIYVNGNSVGTSPAYASGTGDWIYEVFNVNSAYLTAGINEINITASSGNGETIFVDYIGLGDRSDISNNLASNNSWVIAYANISTTETLDTVLNLVKNESGGTITNTNDVATKTIGTYTHMYIYQLPNVNQNYSFGFQANTTTEATLTSSSNDPEVEIDSTNPVLNSVTLNLNSYIGETEQYLVNLTEKNVDYVTVNVNGTNYNLSLNSSNGNEHIYNLSFNYLVSGVNDVTFTVYDLVGKTDTYNVNVDVSNITQSIGTWNFNPLFNYTNYISVGDTFSYNDQTFRIPVTISAIGTAYITDWNGSYNISDTNPVNINVTLENGTIRTFSNNTINLSWLSDSFNNTISKLNYVSYSVENALGVEWENSGVSDTRLFYINKYNLTNVPKNISLQVPLRTTYSGNSSSIDIYECTDTLNWALKTCNQWTEITTDVFTQNTLTYHHWGNDVSDYPTVDTNSDGKKDVLRITINNLTSERMFKIEVDGANAEVTWSVQETPSETISTGGGGGGLSSTLLSSSTSDDTTNTTAVKSNSNAYISGFWEFTDVVITWVGDLFGGAFDSLAPLFNGDPKNTILIILIAVMLIGIPLVSGSPNTKRRGVASS